MNSKYDLAQSDLISHGSVKSQTQDGKVDGESFVEQLRGQFDWWRSQTFSVGAELLSYQASPSRDGGDRSAPGWFVVQGRVRLLSVNTQRARLRSATVLQVGELFGADHWFGATPLPYRAVAASDCEIVQVSQPQMAALIEQYPELQTAWQAQIQRQAQQIFFKRYTNLQALPSQVLHRLLLPRLRVIELAAGQSLGQAIAPYEGYFWLRAGELQCPALPEQKLPVGAGWPDRDQALLDWVAYRPAKIYQFQFHPWETAQLRRVLNCLTAAAS